ncbi:MAG: hypothetical protein ACOYN0_17750 [Phycisphaerales bacterium]
MISSVVDLSQIMAATGGNPMLASQQLNPAGTSGVGASSFGQTDFGASRAQGVGARPEATEATGVAPTDSTPRSCARMHHFESHQTTASAQVNGANRGFSMPSDPRSKVSKTTEVNTDIEALTRSNRETIDLQIKVQEISLRSEMLSKMAEHATGSTKTVLQTQT